ncbi:MAG TPA: aspartate--tRNA(Asn) ligase [Candidatus Yonathbacteria bacterium]|nr:aspartate--tRNA(Asn) ligase [Candidatus Yonathbacteria bacterium]
MERTYIKDLHGHIGKEVKIAGWVDVRRDQGKMVFFDFRDATGKVQGVVLPGSDAMDSAKESRGEYVVEVLGKVNERPGNAAKEGLANGDIEIEVLGMEILSRAEELPFDRETELNLDTYLDNLPLTLRTEKARSIFRVQASLIQSFRWFLIQKNFTEIQVPKLVGGDAEGGAEVFEVDYFGKRANLATSPQLYKQIMVGVFERVFSTGNVYRAEKHATSRHLNEYTSLDFEMGFIKDHTDIMKTTRDYLVNAMSNLKENRAENFALFNMEIPDVPDEIPTFKLIDAQEIIKKEFDEDCAGAPDLEPQHERLICEYAKEKHNSDFVFITHYPRKKRPFYTMEDEDDKGFTKSFDLLFRGLEIATGGQRVHDYKKLVENIKEWGLNPEDFAFYLQAFKYGMPPEGGIGLGLERLTEKLLGLSNVKEAALFPRDMNRIDTRLSE